MQVEEKVTPLISLPDARLSEGITYIKEYSRYYWVDIFKSMIYSVPVTTPTTDILSLHISKDNYALDSEAQKDSSSAKYPKYPYPDSPYPERVGVVFPTTNSEHKVLFGGKYGLGVADLVTKTWYYRVLYREIQNFSTDVNKTVKHDWSRMRSNDGNICPSTNSVYIGLMNDFHITKCTTEGFVCKIDLSRDSHTKDTISCVYEGIRIPNSVNFFGSDIYLTDSLQSQILKISNGVHLKHWQHDGEGSHITQFINTRTHNTEFESPEPDGSVIINDKATDATGADNPKLITSVWSTSKLQEYSLTTGELLEEHLIPHAANISCCCVGPLMSDLVVTTASLDLEVRGGEPNKDGSLFKVTRNAPTSGAQAPSSKKLLTL
ncbi:hypothetical protein ACO0QE_000768 [Hanseniaspora vineae]